MTLVSIIGDFHSSVLPVYHQFRNNIKKHIIIYDDLKNDVNEAKNIIRGIKNFNKNHNLKIKQYTHCIDEDSYDAILSVVEFIKFHQKKSRDLYINTTDGLSNINTIIGLKLLPLGAKLISYDRYDNEVNIIDNGKMNTYKIDQSISIKDHFILRDIKVNVTGNKKFAKKYKNEILTLFEKKYKKFKSFANYVQDASNPNLNNKNYKEINKIIQRMNIVNLKKNQTLITGGLFEYYIFLKLANLNYDDIEVGTVVQKFIDDVNYVENEFDILIMKENHLHMVECKFTKGVKLEVLVYKYMGLKSLLDDDGKMYILTSHKNPKNILSNPNPTAYAHHKRALENKILLKGNPLEDIDGFVEDIRRYFEL